MTKNQEIVAKLKNNFYSMLKFMIEDELYTKEHLKVEIKKQQKELDKLIDSLPEKDD